MFTGGRDGCADCSHEVGRTPSGETDRKKRYVQWLCCHLLWSPFLRHFSALLRGSIWLCIKYSKTLYWPLKDDPCNSRGSGTPLSFQWRNTCKLSEHRCDTHYSVLQINCQKKIGRWHSQNLINTYLLFKKQHYQQFSSLCTLPFLFKTVLFQKKKEKKNVRETRSMVVNNLMFLIILTSYRQDFTVTILRCLEFSFVWINKLLSCLSLDVTHHW